MITKDTGGPAFPYATETRGFEPKYGMTLRDYFATHAPDPPGNFWRGGERSIKDIVDWRWHYADAMLKAREQ